MSSITLNSSFLSLLLYRPGWPHTFFAAQAIFKLIILLPHPLQCSVYRPVSSWPVKYTCNSKGINATFLNSKQWVLLSKKHLICPSPRRALGLAHSTRQWYFFEPQAVRGSAMYPWMTEYPEVLCRGKSPLQSCSEMIEKGKGEWIYRKG